MSILHFVLLFPWTYYLFFQLMEHVPYGTTVSNLIAMMLIWDPASRPNIDQVITQLNKVDEEINPRA